jgi:erythromycin esterase
MEPQPFDQNRSTEHEQEIIAWLRQNSFPIEHIEPGNGFVDLQPLKMVLKDVKVVGLGEATHGTREFFLFKHRLVEFLVTQMNFTTFALESSFAAYEPINDYVLYGKGDRASVLSGQGYLCWDTEEFSSLLDWLRDYNQSVPPEKKVKFYGLHIWHNGLARKKVLNFLRKVAPERLADTRVLFKSLAREEKKWPFRIDEKTKKTLLLLLPQVQEFIDYLALNKSQFVSRTSLDEFERAMQYIGVMKQLLIDNLADLLPEPERKNRSAWMAENMKYIADQSSPNDKYIVWAANPHLSKSLLDMWDNRPNLGYCLQEYYGNRYYVFGFKFNQGSFRVKTLLPNNLLGVHKEITVPPSPAGSLDWYCSHANRGDAIFNLRTPTGSPVIEQWLDTPQVVSGAGWPDNDESEYLGLDKLIDYDGLVFVEKTSAAIPTENALRNASKKEMDFRK